MGGFQRGLIGWCLALCVACAYAQVALPSATEGMPPVAATFYAFWRQAYGRPFEEQEQLWDRLVEKPRRALYDAVVWEHARGPQALSRRRWLLEQRFAAYAGLAPRMYLGSQALLPSIDVQAARFRALFPGADAKPPVELLLAPNFDAKSGVLDDGRPVLALAVDTLLLERADLDVLLPHELFHLYHAEHAGISNDGVMPGADLTLPLFEEGLATYVSSQLALGRGDGGWLMQDDLGALPAQRLPEIARRFLADAAAKADDPTHPEAYRRWFGAGSPAYQRDLPNRSGYWLGLQVIRAMREHHELGEIVAWSPAQAMRQTGDTLRQLASRDAK